MIYEKRTSFHDDETCFVNSNSHRAYGNSGHGRIYRIRKNNRQLKRLMLMNLEVKR
jgi:hypothetical protein